MTVKELLRRIDSREISEWWAFYMNEAEAEKQAGLESRARAKINAPRQKLR